MQADFPLFPLPLVATPHSRTALQIFEPRYLDLIKSSMSAQQCFGLIMLDAQQRRRLLFQWVLQCVLLISVSSLMAC